MQFLEKKCSVNQHGRLVMWLQTKSFGVYCKDGFPLWRNLLRMYTRVKFTCVNKIEEKYEGSRVNIKAYFLCESTSCTTRTFNLNVTRDHAYIASILFTPVKFTCVRT